MTPQLEKLQVLRDKLRDKRRAIHHMLTTPDGKVLMTALTEEFFEGSLYDSDPMKMSMNLGAREVVRYLRFLANAQEE